MPEADRRAWDPYAPHPRPNDPPDKPSRKAKSKKDDDQPELTIEVADGKDEADG